MKVPQKIRFDKCKSLVQSYMTTAHAQQHARTHAILKAHIPRNCSKSLNQPISSSAGKRLSLGTHPLAAVKSCSPINVRFQARKCRRSDKTHQQLIERTHSARINLPVDKVCSVIETWLGLLSKTQHILNVCHGNASDCFLQYCLAIVLPILLLCVVCWCTRCHSYLTHYAFV